METLSIGEVALRAGIPASAIRYYERVGVLSPPARVNGRRRYSPDVFRSLMLLRLGQAAGFTLKELRAISERDTGDTAAGNEWRPSAERKLGVVRGQIARLRTTERLLLDGLSCDCGDIVDCDRVRLAVVHATQAIQGRAR